MHPTIAWKRAAIGSLLCAASLLACGKKKNDEAEAAALLGVAAVTEGDRTQAREIFATRCTPCHGPTGGGDGPASSGLTPKPRNFHDAAWQTSVNNEHITKIIRFGGASVGKSPAMPANPDLTEKGGVVAALTARVRSFGE
jgi:mono/diheme cytochrome c family protein